MINTGRSSLLDIYQSDIDTNSDTINDFSQYSENGRVDIKESTTEPIIQTNESINVDNITFSPKMPTPEINGFHVDNESDEEEDSRFEITKKTTIRKIITRTTSINGVEKENEVKEFLIKDSQMNESLTDTKKKEDGGMFSRSRRGSHASLWKKSPNEGKGKSRRASEVNDQFKSDLEKVRDEFDGKERPGLSWRSPVDILDEDSYLPEQIGVRICHTDHQPMIKEDKNEIVEVESTDGIVVDLRKLEEEENTIHFISPSTVCEGTQAGSQVGPSVGEVKWVDPMKSCHLKYDSKSDRSSRARSTDEHKRILVIAPTRPKTQTTTSFMKDKNGRRSFANIKSKVPLGNSTKNDIKEYIIRGNIKENMYQSRHYNTKEPKYQSNRVSPSRRDFKVQKSVQSNEYKQPQTQSYGSMNSINDVKKQRPSNVQHLVQPRRQSSRIENTQSSLKTFESIERIDDTDGKSVMRNKTIRSRVSSILNKVEDVERHLLKSSQSIPHQCLAYARHCCSPCSHICSCCVNNCQEMSFMTDPTIRSCSATIERNYYRSTEVPSIKLNGTPTKNVFMSKERGSISYEKKNPSVLLKRIHMLERRLHTLKTDLEDFKTSEEISSSNSEVNVKSQCKSMEQQLQQLYESIHQIRAVS